MQWQTLRFKGWFNCFGKCSVYSLHYDKYVKFLGGRPSYAPRMKIRITIQSTTAIIPQMIPAFAIPSPSNSWGFSLIRLVAIAPKIIANGPRTIPKITRPTIPHTIDVTASALVFGLTCVGDTAEPMAIDAVGLLLVMEADAVGVDMMMRLWRGSWTKVEFRFFVRAVKWNCWLVDTTKNAREIEIDLLQILVQLLRFLFEIRFSTTSQRAWFRTRKPHTKQTQTNNQCMKPAWQLHWR